MAKTLQVPVDGSREKLLQHAELLFAEHGFTGVSVRDISTAAGVNSALVGYYFGGKQGLLAEVYTRHCVPLNLERARLLKEAQAAGSVLEMFCTPSSPPRLR